MNGVLCDGAIIVSPGEPAANIPDTLIEVRGPLFDLGVFAAEDRSGFVETARSELEKAFAGIIDRGVTVLFDFEDEDTGAPKP